MKLEAESFARQFYQREFGQAWDSNRSKIEQALAEAFVTGRAWNEEAKSDKTVRKPFIDQLNDIIAPVTRAWVDPEILEVTLTPQKETGTDDITVEIKLKLLHKRFRVPFTLAKG